MLSDDHFWVDGTLVKAWASMKCFQPKEAATPPDDDGPVDPPAPDTTPETKPSETPAEPSQMSRYSRRHRNAEVDFKGERCSNATHASTSRDTVSCRNRSGLSSSQPRTSGAWASNTSERRSPPIGSASARPSRCQVAARRTAVAREIRVLRPAALADMPSSNTATNRPSKSEHYGFRIHAAPYTAVSMSQKSGWRGIPRIQDARDLLQPPVCRAYPVTRGRGRRPPSRTSTAMMSSIPVPSRRLAIT